jgi:prophage regulatory protein
MAETKPRRFLTQHQVIDRVSLSRATIYKMVSEGTFPRSHKVGTYSIRWLESDIEDFIAAVIADRPWDSKIRSLSGSEDRPDATPSEQPRRGGRR